MDIDNSMNGDNTSNETTKLTSFGEYPTPSKSVPGSPALRELAEAAMTQSLTGHFEHFHKSSGALNACFLAIAVYLFIGVIAFSFVFERWTIIDSVYFSVVTFTTVGYGDLYPKTPPGQVFCIFFVLFGILIIGVALGMIGERVVEAQEAVIEEQKRKSKFRVQALFKRNNKNGQNVTTSTSQKVEKGFISAGAIQNEILDLVMKNGPLVLVIITVSLLFGWVEGWGVGRSIYYCFITTTTVGYGDMHPNTQLTRFIAIFYIPATVSILAAVLGRIAGFYMKMKTQESEKRFLDRELTLADISVMDTDDDGAVDLVEFLTFMLDAMQKVSKEDIEELKQVFKKLDVDGSGTLQKEDLVLMRERNTEKSMNSDNTV